MVCPRRLMTKPEEVCKLSKSLCVREMMEHMSLCVFA
jgi:hypothetical protein